MGRPSSYTPELAAEVCERMSNGETLADICRSGHMPPVRTVYNWRDQHPSFLADFGRARDAGFDVIANDCLHIADATGHDTLHGEQGPRPDTEWISRSKLRIETRLKLLAKWDPRRYGDKQAVELTGKDGAPLELDSTARAARLAALTARLEARATGNADDVEDLA